MVNWLQFLGEASLCLLAITAIYWLLLRLGVVMRLVFERFYSLLFLK